MTGGQMAPTTLLGQKTTSSPDGRDATATGWPIPITDMLAVLPGVAYAARGSIADPGWIGRTKAMLRRSFELQEQGAGFSIVEVLSTCPVGWGMTPTEAMAHVSRDVAAVYPPGVLVDRPKLASDAARAAGG
jgi:2-oxoglutarate ferredoxin oxidoreductase subunit beta